MRNNYLLTQKLLLFSLILLTIFVGQVYARETSCDVDIEIDYDTKDFFPFLGCYAVKSISEELGEEIGYVHGVFKNDSSQEKILRTTIEIKGWSDSSSKEITLQPGEELAPSFDVVCKDNILNNMEEKPASLEIMVEDAVSGKKCKQETKQITLKPTNAMLWGSFEDNQNVDLSLFIAMWVTPNDPVIKQITKYAKENMENRTMAGYQSGDQHVIGQLQAIYETLKQIGISYTSMGVSFDSGGQIVRFPWQSVKEKQANCIDGTVLFASAVEALGMHPTIVLVPGHAYLGVQMDEEGKKGSIYIETTMLGTDTFQEAWKQGNEEISKAIKAYDNNEPGTTFILIKKARSIGIKPIPVQSDIEVDVDYTGSNETTPADTNEQTTGTEDVCDAGYTPYCPAELPYGPYINQSNGQLFCCKNENQTGCVYEFLCCNSAGNCNVMSY